MKIKIMAAIINRKPKNLMTLGNFDSLATNRNKLPKTNRTTIADIYSEVVPILFSIQPNMISGLISNEIPIRRMSIPNNLIINFMISFFINWFIFFNDLQC